MQSGASNIRQNQPSIKERFPAINAKIIENINRNLGKPDPIVFNVVPSLISDSFLNCIDFYCKIIVMLRVWTLLSQQWFFLQMYTLPGISLNWNRKYMCNVFQIFRSKLGYNERS